VYAVFAHFPEEIRRRVAGLPHNPWPTGTLRLDDGTGSGCPLMACCHYAGFPTGNAYVGPTKVVYAALCLRGEDRAAAHAASWGLRTPLARELFDQIAAFVGDWDNDRISPAGLPAAMGVAPPAPAP